MKIAFRREYPPKWARGMKMLASELGRSLVDDKPQLGWCFFYQHAN